LEDVFKADYNHIKEKAGSRSLLDGIDKYRKKTNKDEERE
jgi:hypothetical protein